MNKIIIMALALVAFATTAFAEGSLPYDINQKTFSGGAFSGIWSANPGTKGTVSVSSTGKQGLYFNCTQSPTSGTAATVKVGRNGSVATYYHAASGSVNFGSGTGTTSITFASYSTANNNTCAGYYW